MINSYKQNDFYKNKNDEMNQIKFDLLKQHHKDINVINLFSELCKPRISEKEFFDIVKSSFEIASETVYNHFYRSLLI